MKKLRKLLRVPVSAYKNRMVAIKLFIRGYKTEAKAVRQLEKGLLVLDSSGKNVSAGISCYLDYRSGKKDGIVHSIDKSIRLSLEEIARVTRKTTKQLDEATQAAFIKIRKPASKHRVKRVLQMVAVPVASVATFVRKPVKPVVWKWLGLALIVVLILWAIVALFSSSRKVTVDNDDSNKTIVNSSTCATWVMEPMVADDSNNRWFADGIAEISNAKTPEQAKAAFIVWKDKTKSHHNLLVAAGRALLPTDESKFDESTISSDGNCANNITIQLVSQIELAVIGQSKSINVVNAPTNGYNTGVENGIVVGSATPGISGDRRAIQITFRDGRKVWIMGRCGNIVTTKEVFKHHGKTDEHEHHNKPTPPKLTPKSGNINDYQRPGTDKTKDSGSDTKPKASVNTPADSTPPIVSTVKVGGGGVVDTPTNKPVSETGVTAPAAKPAPTTPPAPKPNEGGTNNGVVTD